MKQYQVGVLLLAALAGAQTAVAQTAAFTGVGYLLDGGQPANGLYDLRLTLFDSAYGGRAVTGSAPFGAVMIRDGAIHFTLYPRIEVFQPRRWLEAAVRRNGSADQYTVLSPRQPFVPNGAPALASSGDGALGLSQSAMMVPPIAVEVVVVGRRPGTLNGNGVAPTSQRAQRNPTSVPTATPGNVRAGALPQAVPTPPPPAAIPMPNASPRVTPVLAPMAARR